MLAIYSLAMQWMCQAHHSVVETRSASRDLDKLPTFACSMYNWSFHLKSISSQTSSLHQSLMFPYTHALLYSKNIYPHLLTKFQVSKVTANLTEVCGEFDHVWWTHCTLNWSVQWVWPCMASRVDPHLLTKFQVIKLTAQLIEASSEFDHVWWSYCTLNWSVQWVWPCLSLEGPQK